ATSEASRGRYAPRHEWVRGQGSRDDESSPARCASPRVFRQATQVCSFNLLARRKQGRTFRAAPRSWPLRTALANPAYQIGKRTQQEQKAKQKEPGRRSELNKGAENELKDNEQDERVERELDQSRRTALGVEQITETH